MGREKWVGEHTSQEMTNSSSKLSGCFPFLSSASIPDVVTILLFGGITAAAEMRPWLS
jgi:hypothetical protein